jgi:hypothetical protein
MLMKGRILVGSLREFKTKKGEALPKASVKVVDMGPECSSDVVTYWIDFLGDAAPSQVELDSAMGEEFAIDVRLCRVSLGRDGKAYLNLNGGAIIDAQGQVLQAGLRQRQLKKAS